MGRSFRLPLLPPGHSTSHTPICIGTSIHLISLPHPHSYSYPFLHPLAPPSRLYHAPSKPSPRVSARPSTQPWTK